MIDLTVIVVSHGHENQITRCLRSLNRALEGIRAEVVVVDNTGRGNIRSRLDGTDPPTALLVNRAPAGL